MGVESIGEGVGAVGRTTIEGEKGNIDEAACEYCVGSVDCGMKSEIEGRIEAFKKTLANASAITF